jgi:hypothetical protein
MKFSTLPGNTPGSKEKDPDVGRISARLAVHEFAAGRGLLDGVVVIAVPWDLLGAFFHGLSPRARGRLLVSGSLVNRDPSGIVPRGVAREQQRPEPGFERVHRPDGTTMAIGPDRLLDARIRCRRSLRPSAYARLALFGRGRGRGDRETG